MFCSFVVFALAADNGMLLLSRLPGVLATIAFVLTACATGFISARAIKGLRRQLH